MSGAGSRRGWPHPEMAPVVHLLIRQSRSWAIDDHANLLGVRLLHGGVFTDHTLGECRRLVVLRQWFKHLCVEAAPWYERATVHVPCCGNEQWASRNGTQVGVIGVVSLVGVVEHGRVWSVWSAWSAWSAWSVWSV